LFTSNKVFDIKQAEAMNFKVFILLAMTQCMANLYAQTDSVISLSLKEAQEHALENNRTLRSSQIDLEIAKKKIWETTAIGLPQFSVTGSYQHIFKVPEFGIPLTGYTQNPLVLDDAVEGFDQFQSVGGLNQYYYEGDKIPLGAKDNATFDFTLSQLIFSGEYIVGLQASRVYREFSEQQLAKTENDVRESVANSYYLVLVLSRNLEILDESLEVVSKTRHEMTEMFRQGFVQETDADQLTIIYSQLENTVFTLKGQLEVSKKLFKMQLGMDFEEQLDLTDSIEGLLLETNFELLDTTRFNVVNNVNYQMVSTAADLSELSLRREKSKFLPTFAAFYQHEEQTNPAQFNFMPPDIVGVRMNFNIFSSGQRLSTISQSQLAFEKAKLAEKDAEQGLSMQFETAKNNYITALKSYETNLENFKLAKKIFDRSVISFREGMATSLELTQNQRQYLTTESDYLNGIVKLLSAKAQLDNLLNL
jgi:outer membrane protein